jgi:hypothetical protein
MLELLCIRLGTIVWTKLDGWPWPWWPGKSRLYIKLFFVCFFGIFNYHLRNSDRLAIFMMLFVLFYLVTFVDITIKESLLLTMTVGVWAATSEKTD